MSTEDDRQPLHTRQISCRAFRLKNGLIEIEATLSDEKAQQVDFRSRPPVRVGERMHYMELSIAIDDDYVIHDVKVRTLTAPWSACGGTDAAYRGLVGLRIGAGFSRRVKELLGGSRGCTHVTELVAQAANTYMQASWPDRIARQTTADRDPRRWPDKSTLGFVNKCHAWREDGETLRQEYPELVPEKK